ncbi:hypothetical protein AMK59_3066, partial [Oryctes borbonicus]
GTRKSKNEKILEIDNEKILTIITDPMLINEPQKSVTETNTVIPKKPLENNVPSNHSENSKHDFINEVLSIKKIDTLLQMQSNSTNYISTSANSEYSDSNERKDFVNIDPPAAPPRKRSNNRQSLTISMKTNNPVTVVSPVVVDETINKTIVKISLPSTQPVHKLKIRNEFPETTPNSVTISDNNLGKTSILINGDDCYCTVNVKDDVSIYQSSVIVKDAGITVQTSDRKSSSIYITGNFVDTSNIQRNNSVVEE